MRIYGRAGHTQGFTLIEMLVVIVIIMILVGMVASAFHRARINALEKKRNADKQTISSALRAFRYEYQRWPCPVPAAANWDDEPDRIYEDDNYIVINRYLMGNIDGQGNIHGINFLTLGDFRFKSTANPAHSNIVDYKDAPYKITISFANDNATVE
jgi:prepilin-type N-terminal cleavage/methylation domain-containing protein